MVQYRQGTGILNQSESVDFHSNNRQPRPPQATRVLLYVPRNQAFRFAPIGGHSMEFEGERSMLFGQELLLLITYYDTYSKTYLLFNASSAGY